MSCLRAKARQVMPPLPLQVFLDLKVLDKIAIEELPTASGLADYGLFVDGNLLGIIEAKKVTVNPQNVLEQAKRYAAGVFAAVGEWDGLRVPFLYASNGTLVWHLDAGPANRLSRPKPFAGSVKTLGPATLAHLKTPAATGGAIFEGGGNGF